MNKERTPAEHNEMIRQGFEMAGRIRPMLAGNPPDVIAVALGELTSILMAGHHPLIREEIFENYIKLLRDLTVQNERALLEKYGGKWPENQ